ncbi:MAG: hypothetical protein WCT02_02965 [Candidatus Paceibacterota bacterium]|jgi:hypothetical protein
MYKQLKEKLKKIPGLGTFLVKTRRFSREAGDALINIVYYAKANLGRQDKLLINDETHQYLAVRGLFSLFRETLDIIAANGRKDIEIDYRHTLYNESANQNMWEYYFYPVNNEIKRKYMYYAAKRPYKDVFSCDKPRQLALFNKIIRDRIKIKETLTDKADFFWNKYLKGTKVIGIHYRGTDIHVTIDVYKDILKQPVIAEIFSEVDRLLLSGYEAIYLATDEEKTLRSFKERYGHKLISYETERSSDGKALHFVTKKKRQQGEDVIIEVLILSKCHFFLYGCSNVATVVKYMNPEIPSRNMSLIKQP